MQSVFTVLILKLKQYAILNCPELVGLFWIEVVIYRLGYLGVGWLKNGRALPLLRINLFGFFIFILGRLREQ